MPAVGSMKTCSKCGEAKPVSAFRKRKKSADGLQYNCNSCSSAADRARYCLDPAKTVARVKQYRKDNAEEHRARRRDYIARNREKYRAVNRTWYACHRETTSARQRDYYQTNKAQIHARRRAKRQTDVNTRLCCNLRGRLFHAVKAGTKTGSAVRDLGCSIVELKAYLAAMFSSGMSWDNYGAWEIDHIRPLAAFDLTDPEQAKQACHHTNLQPLWAAENRSKGARVEEAVA